MISILPKFNQNRESRNAILFRGVNISYDNTANITETKLVCIFWAPITHCPDAEAARLTAVCIVDTVNSDNPSISQFHSLTCNTDIPWNLLKAICFKVVHYMFRPIWPSSGVMNYGWGNCCLLYRCLGCLYTYTVSAMRMCVRGGGLCSFLLLCCVSCFPMLGLWN
jgi:hypothetical protein